MIDQIREWVIKRLGGYTNKQQDSLRGNIASLVYTFSNRTGYHRGEFVVPKNGRTISAGFLVDLIHKGSESDIRSIREILND